MGGERLAPAAAGPWQQAALLAATLGIGAVGGWLATQAKLPLAWMIGSLLVVMVAALARLPVRLPRRLRDVTVPVLGVMLGSAFTPDLLDRLTAWALSIGALLVYVVAVNLSLAWVLRRFWGYDRVTAYFAAAPGGLNEMVLVGGALGGDERVLTLIHSARVMLVVLAVPFWFMLTVGYEPGGAIGAAGWGEASDIAWLAASGIVGYAIGKALRMPAGSLLGPMLVSAAVHLGGLTGSAPPATLVAVAQLVMGCSLGCRFAGTALPAVFRALGAAIPITLAMLAVMALFAWGLSAVTGISPIVIALAYAPGGLAEMSLIALYLGQDPAFVSSHHIIRISLIISLAPALFRLVDRKPAP